MTRTHQRNQAGKLLAIVALCLPVLAQAFPGALSLSMKEGAVTRSLAISNWRVDGRGVSSFDYRYTQSGPDCDYERAGRAVAGHEDAGDHVELEVYNPQEADGSEGAPIGVFYDDDGSVVFSMPVQGKSRRFWISFEDSVMKQKLPKKCGYTGRGAAVTFRK